MRKNIGLKLLSIIAAIFAWLFATSEANLSVKTIPVRVVYKQEVDDKVIVSDPIKEIKMTVRGPTILVARLENSPPLYVVEVPKSEGSRFTVKLRKDELAVLPPVEVLDIKPDTIEVKTENLIRREVKVEVPLKNARSLQITKVEPESIFIEGPESQVKPLKLIKSEEIDAGILETPEDGEKITVTARIQTFPEGISSPTTSVSVFFSKKIEPIRKLFQDINISVERQGKIIHSENTSPKSVSIELKGNPNQLVKITADDLRPTVNVNKSENGEYPVNLETPQGIEIISIKPSKVSLQAKASKKK